MTEKRSANALPHPGIAREAAAIRVLLTGVHQPTVSSLSESLRARSIFVETCPASHALSHLCKAKYEGLIVDVNEGEGALEVLRNVRTLTSNKGVVCCAVLNHRSETGTAYRAGANFVLERPLQSDVVSRTLEAAYPMMLLERRRYFRCPVQVRMRIAREDGSDHEALSMNLSEGGMAFESSLTLCPDEIVEVRFRLPGETEEVCAQGMVCWAQSPGRAGIQFTQVSSAAALRIQSWVAERVYELTPA